MYRTVTEGEVADYIPALASVGVVPLGVSDHTTEAEMRPHTEAEAARVVELEASAKAVDDNITRAAVEVSDLEDLEQLIRVVEAIPDVLAAEAFFFASPAWRLRCSPDSITWRSHTRCSYR